MSKRILNDDFRLNGMPCHKYILRHLRSTVDAIVFRKTYVNTMIAAGARYEELEALLPLLSLKLDPNSPIAGYDFYGTVKPISGFSFIDSIRFNEDVATFRSCDRFYKQFDKKKTACRLCPLSNTYLNKNFDLEKAVLTYALSSPSAFQHVFDKKVTADHFKSVIDIMRPFSYTQKASYYPLFAQTFLALQDPKIRDDYFSSKSAGNISADLIAYHDESLTDHYIPRGMLSADMIVKLEQVLVDELGKGKCPATSEIDAFISKLLAIDSPAAKETSAAATSKSNTQIAAQSNMGIDTLDSFYNVPVAATKTAKKKNKRKEFSTSVVKDTPPAAPEHIKDAEIVSKLPCKSGCYRGVPEEQIFVREIPDTQAPEDAYIYEDTYSNLVTLPLVPAAELTKFALSLDSGNVRLLSMFESYVLKDKCLNMELIQSDEDTAYLLMYVPYMRAYLYTDLSIPMVREVLTPILEQKTVTKYCYYPYATLSSLWKIGIYVRGLYSLFSMSTLLFGDHNMEMKTAFEKMSAAKAVGGITIKPCGEIKSVPLNYMHDYLHVFFRSRYLLLKLGLFPEYEVRNHFDRTLSYSFYQDHLIENRQTLFSLTTANHYRFTSNPGAPRTGYSLIRCTFRGHKLLSFSFVRGLINKLESAGHFRKRKLFLTSLSTDSFTLCMKETELKQAATIVNTTILAYMKDQDFFGLSYDLEIN